MRTKATTHVEPGDAIGLLAGSGIVLMQAAAVIPGLLPVLLVTLPFVLALVVLGVGVGAVIGVPFGLWRLAGWLVRSVRRPPVRRATERGEVYATTAQA
jgi:hypothetical protein